MIEHRSYIGVLRRSQFGSGASSAAGTTRNLLLRFHDRDGNQLFRFDGDVPGLAGPPPLRHRAAPLTLYETAAQQVHDAEEALNDFLQQL
jgi:hypothetical protein